MSAPALSLPSPVVLKEPPPPTPGHTPAQPGAALGCGIYDIYILERGGGVIRHAVTTWTNLAYNMPAGDVGQATVSLAGLSQDQFSECCRALRDVVPWADELALYRRAEGDVQGDLVWIGPIQDPTLDRETAQLTAQDLAGWFDVRFVHTDHAWTGIDAARVAQDIVADALRPDPSPRITITTDGAGFDWSETVDASGYVLAGERLRALSAGGLRWYMQQRGFVATGDPDAPLLLTDAHFEGMPQIKLVGTSQATRVVVTGQGVGAASAITATATSSQASLYGLVERVQRTQASTVDAAQVEADAWLETVEHPVALVESGIINPDAPLRFTDLTPGRRVHIHLADTCYPIDGFYRLANVAVDTTGGTEKITGHFTPIGETLA